MINMSSQECNLKAKPPRPLRIVTIPNCYNLNLHGRVSITNFYWNLIYIYTALGLNIVYEAYFYHFRTKQISNKIFKVSTHNDKQNIQILKPDSILKSSINSKYVCHSSLQNFPTFDVSKNKTISVHFISSRI